MFKQTFFSLCVCFQAAFAAEMLPFVDWKALQDLSQKHWRVHEFTERAQYFYEQNRRQDTIARLISCASHTIFFEPESMLFFKAAADLGSFRAQIQYGAYLCREAQSPEEFLKGQEYLKAGDAQKFNIKSALYKRYVDEKVQSFLYGAFKSPKKAWTLKKPKVP